MGCRPRQLLSTWAWTVALILITSVILSTGHEGHVKGKNETGDATVSTSLENGSNKTKTLADMSDDYEWNNTDDYSHHEEQRSAQDSADNHSGNDPLPAESLPNPPLSNDTALATNVSSSVDLTQSSNVTENGANLSNETEHQQSNQPSTNTTDVDVGSAEDSSSAENELSKEDDGVALNMNSATDEDSETTLANSVTSLPTGESSSSSSTTTEVVTTAKTGSPHPIETQDAGEHFTNYTTPAFQADENWEVPPETSRAWAIVLVSVLICFVVIFTLLYFVRRALIRRRKADQRKLLRASMSSEGFFYGDGEGEGNNVGKFEL